MCAPGRSARVSPGQPPSGRLAPAPALGPSATTRTWRGLTPDRAPRPWALGAEAAFVVSLTLDAPASVTGRKAPAVTDSEAPSGHRPPSFVGSGWGPAIGAQVILAGRHGPRADNGASTSGQVVAKGGEQSALARIAGRARGCRAPGRPGRTSTKSGPEARRLALGRRGLTPLRLTHVR